MDTTHEQEGRQDSPAGPLPRTARPAAERRRWVALTVLLLATFMGMVDLFIVNVAAPSIQADLHSGFGDIQLVMAGYTLAYAVGLVTGGRVGDAWGRGRVFVLGVLAFGVASAACAMAPETTVLVVARVFQGLSAALMLPQVLAIVQVMFTPEERARPLGLYGAAICVGAIAGQVFGGLLVRLDVAGLGWRTIFLVNIPVCAVAAVGGLLTLDRTRAAVRTRLDLLGVTLLAAGLLCLMYPLVIGSEHGWSGSASGMLVAAAVLLAGFVVWERRVDRRGGAPLLPPHLFRRPAFSKGLLTALVFYSGNTGFVLMLSYYLQDGLHLGSFGTGSAFVPMAVASAAASLSMRRLAARFGHRLTLAGAAALIVGEAACRAAVGVGSPTTQALLLLPGLMLAGFGQGLVAPALIGLVLADVAPEDAGAASGGLLTATQVANALGIVAIGTAFTTLVSSGGYVHAFGIALIVLCALAAATLALLVALRPAPAPAAER